MSIIKPMDINNVISKSNINFGLFSDYLAHNPSSALNIYDFPNLLEKKGKLFQTIDNFIEMLKMNTTTDFNIIVTNNHVT